MKGTFLTDVQEIRRRARQHVEQGAVTEGYRADRETVIKLLNEALATEIVCVLRYKRHYFMATGIHAESVAKEFKQHAADEQEHADEIAEPSEFVRAGLPLRARRMEVSFRFMEAGRYLALFARAQNSRRKCAASG